MTDAIDDFFYVGGYLGLIMLSTMLCIGGALLAAGEGPVRWRMLQRVGGVILVWFGYTLVIVTMKDLFG